MPPKGYSLLRLFRGFVNGLLRRMFHLVTCFLNGLLGCTPCISGSVLDGSPRILYILLRVLCISGKALAPPTSANSKKAVRVLFRRFMMFLQVGFDRENKESRKPDPALFPQLVLSDARYRMSVPVA